MRGDPDPLRLIRPRYLCLENFAELGDSAMWLAMKPAVLGIIGG